MKLENFEFYECSKLFNFQLNRTLSMITLNIIIDMQNDFINGVFANREAERVLINIIKYIREIVRKEDEETKLNNDEFLDQDSNKGSTDKFILTRDIHDDNYLNTQEGKYLPVVHCQKGTWGAELNTDLLAALIGNNYEIMDKSTFSSLDLLERVEKIKPSRLVLMGLCTDICVISNALLLKSHFPDLPIFVKSTCMAGSSLDKHLSALDILNSCQIYDLDQ